MKLQKDKIKKFQRKILTWYKKNKRDLPWRKSRNPYRILISEVMLQQTQVGRVIEKYNQWIKAFPTLKSLANASFRDVLSAWSGLGYNRRVLYLQQLAQELTKNHTGKFPQDEKDLLKLPGIGKYTARALLCFAFDQQIAVVDTNIRKVIAIHFFKGKVPKEEVVEEIAQSLLPKGKAYEWNQALMDYASVELKLEKIPIPKQSKFKDSDRYYRGEILRMLLINPAYSIEQIQKHFEKIKKEIERERLERIVESLAKDKLVQSQGGIVTL